MKVAFATPEAGASASGRKADIKPASIARAYFRISRGFWSGPTQRVAWLLTLGVLAFVFASLLTALGVNWWNRFFFNAIERKDVGSVLSGVGAIVGLAAAAAAAAVCLVHMRMRLQLRWRQWMTSYLIRRWLAERRFYQLNIVGGEGSHPEYRIAEDVRLATEPLVDFVIGLTNALLAAVAFISILWIVGGSLTISAFGAPLTIPGFMVIAAIVYSSLTSLAMFFVGRPLIAAVESKNAGEAQLRYELTSVRDSAENIALIGGDDDARAQLQDTFGELARRWVRVIVKQAHMTWISNGSAVLSPAVPLVIAAPKYLAGDLSLGELMQIATAFAQVQIALNWLVDNAIRLAEWLASAQRVVELNDALDNLETTIGRYGSGNTVVLGHSPDDAIHLQHLSLTQHNGTAMIEGAEVIVGRGEKGSGQGRIGHREKHSDPRDGGALAVGIGPHPAPEGRHLRLHAAIAIHPARNLAPRAPLSGERPRRVRRDAGRGPRTLRPRPSRAPARRRGSVGQHPVRGGAPAPRLRAAAGQPAAGHHHG
jgi:putative ATP-binding cassette transporter